MRLLRESPDGSLRLASFTDENIVPYAILSHTWSREEQDEVTMEDVLAGKGEKKRGWAKLRFCADQAKAHGLSYFWIDTCCIDRSNSSELTEAINSMFRWYQRAETCLVYLADVEVLMHEKDGKLLPSTWAPDFRNSRWFTRGWTLQELLAPHLVEFYSRDNVRLGDKASLMGLIQESTGIDPAALQGGRLSEFSIEQRLAWGKGRQTTRGEDKAYALLGICNVYLPLIYGEGQANAFRRLQKEVTDGANNSFELLSRAPSLVMPFERNLRFTGREEELSKLEGLLFHDGKNQNSKVALIGLGGMGKTSLAIELVYRAIEQYKDCSVFWIPATDSESLLQGYLTIAEKLSLSALDNANADMDVKSLVQAHLSKEASGRWLLVYDNADDMDMWMEKPASGASAQRLIDCVPKSKRGSILFTTRDRKLAVKLAQRSVVDLQAMKADVATKLLETCLIEPQSESLERQRDAAKLVEHLTYLPLAIIQAAAYINANGLSLDEYLSLFTEQDQTAIELLSEDFEDEGRYESMSTQNPVATTWLISFDRIRRNDPLAADYLSFMACVEPKDIPQSLPPPGLSRKKELDAIGTLDAYSFITKKSANRSFDLHRLVHLAMRNWLKEKGTSTEWTDKTILRLVEMFPTDDHKNRATWRAYLPHAWHNVLPVSGESWDEARMVLARQVCASLLSDGRIKEAEPLLSAVVQASKRIKGEENKNTLISMANLALMYRELGRYAEAEEQTKAAFERGKVILGEENRDMLSIMHNLASIYSNQERWQEAAELEWRVIEIRKKVLGDDHPETLISLDNIVSMHWQQQRWAEAEKLNLQLIETRKKLRGEDHPETLVSRGNLSSTDRMQGRLDEAAQVGMEVMEGFHRSLGQDHPHTLNSMNNLSYALWSLKRYDEAISLMTECLEGRVRVLGAGHLNTESSKETLQMWKKKLEDDVETRAT